MEQLFRLNRRIPVVFLSVMLVGMTLVVFGQVWQDEFVNYDDDQYVIDNPHVKSGLTWSGVRWALTTFHASNWHPLTWLSHMLDIELFGMNPAGHHLTNVVLHAVNGLLLFWILLRMSGRLWPSAFVAALFAVHPLHVESVAWIAERKDVLSTCVGFLTIGAYVRYAARPSVGRYLLVVTLFALSLMAKPMLVTLPMVLLLLDYWPLGRLRLGPGVRHAVWPLVKEKLPLLSLSAAACIVTVLAQQSEGAIKTFETFSFTIRVENALVAYVGYMGKMLWPHGLAVFYPHPGTTLPWWQVAGAVVVLGGITALALRAGKRRPYLPVGWGWYLGTLVPVIGLIQIGSQAMADRYTYVPLIGLSIIVTWGVADLTAGWPRRAVVLMLWGGLVLTALTGVAWSQARYWRNSLTLFEHALAVTTDNYVAHDHVGSALVQQGRIEEALAHYTDALRIRPTSVATLLNMAETLAQQGRFEESGARYREVLRFRPRDARVYNNLGNLYRTQGQWESAVQAYRMALQLRPDLGESHNNLGIVYRHLGQLENAIREYQSAMELEPDLPDVQYNLANVYLDQRRFEDAVREYRVVITMMPSYIDAHNNLGGAYMAMGRWREATEEFEAVLKLHPDARAYYNLGVVSMRQGQIQEARGYFGSALQLDPEYHAARQALQLLPQ